MIGMFNGQRFGRFVSCPEQLRWQVQARCLQVFAVSCGRTCGLLGVMIKYYANQYYAASG